jgi:hypothetical protein
MVYEYLFIYTFNYIPFIRRMVYNCDEMFRNKKLNFMKKSILILEDKMVKCRV